MTVVRVPYSGVAAGWRVGRENQRDGSGSGQRVRCWIRLSAMGTDVTIAQPCLRVIGSSHADSPRNPPLAKYPKCRGHPTRCRALTLAETL